MGMCLEDFGKMAVEVRRESFIIHPSYEGDMGDMPHPEFMLTDLDDLIAALQDAKDYIANRKKR